MTRHSIKLGLEVLLTEQVGLLHGARVGLICNPATVNHAFQHAADLFHEHPEINLTALFGPQHGIRGETQDNMIEWQSFRDPRTGVMAYSLYGTTRQPTAEMLADLDVLVFDVPDVGTRVYTFIIRWRWRCRRRVQRASGSSYLIGLIRPMASASKATCSNQATNHLSGCIRFPCDTA